MRLLVHPSGYFHLAYPETGVYGEGAGELLVDNEINRLYFDVEDFGKYAFGFSPVYTLAAQPPAPIDPWWELCVLIADVQSGAPLIGTLDCTGLLGAEFPTVGVVLVYDESYESGGGVERLVGHWTNRSAPGADVVTFDANGTLTGQHAETGCVYSGRILARSPDHNFFEFAWTFDNCEGTLAPLNGAEIDGVLAVDPTTSPESLWMLAAGDVEGSIPDDFGGRLPVAFIEVFERI